MSKSLRVSNDNGWISPIASQQWNPAELYHQLFGRSDPPCSAEFMKLVTCLEDKPPLACHDRYVALLHCLKKERFE